MKILSSSIVNKCVMVVILSLYVIMSTATTFAAVLPKEDISSINLDTVWHKQYKPVAACTAGSVALNGVGSNITPGQPGTMFLLGDSIGTQITNSLASKLQPASWSLTSNVVAGRTLPQGLETIDLAQDFIKTANVVVVELGTNTGGFTPENVSAAIDKIRGLNPGATIFWVDTAVVERQDYAQSLNQVNSIIYAQSSQKNYQVLSWNKKVFGENADPTNINAAAPDNGYIRRGDEFVHLTDAGITAFADLLASVLTNASNGSSNTTCVVGGGAANCLAGVDNPEKVWNYFIGKGLSPVLTAAILGNLRQESGENIDPTAIQGGGSSQNPEDAGGGGWGIAQWTPGGKILGIAQQAGVTGPIYELGTQLDIVWWEMNNTAPTGYQNFLADFQQISDLEQATMFFANKFEGAGIIGPRFGYAQEFFSKYGSLTPPPGSVGSC